MEIDLITESLKFLVFGMSTVFSFLVLLVLILKVQGKIMSQYFSPIEQKSVVNSQGSLTDTLAVVAAIAATLQTHKK
ncbi:MAG: OadG family protein [Sulfurospirillaceae bacterium]|nr:OadG family protein [Sulfurospirillaceae bacterium]